VVRRRLRRTIDRLRPRSVDAVSALASAHHDTFVRVGALESQLGALASAHHETYLELQDSVGYVGALSDAHATTATRLDELEVRLIAITEELAIARNAVAAQQSAARERRRTDTLMTDRLTRAEAESAAITSRLAPLEQDVADGRGILPRVENTEQAIGAVHARVDAVRSEVMYEIRYGNGHAGITSMRSAEPVPEHLLKLDPLRVNLGSGTLVMADYVNVDARSLPGVDLVADVVEPGFPEGSIDELYAAHLLEHFPDEQLRRQVLPSWLAMLKPGGLLRVVVPDSESMLRRHAAGTFSFEDLRLMTYGGQEYQGDYHFTMFTPVSLAALLESVGFDGVTVAANDRPNGVCFEMELHAHKPT
jgi:hypothetical protein